MLRLAYVGEFLTCRRRDISRPGRKSLAKDPLDLMPWGWKFGLRFRLCRSPSLPYSPALIASEEALLDASRSARWLAAIVTDNFSDGNPALTFYYALQEDAGETDDSSTISNCSLIC